MHAGSMIRPSVRARFASALAAFLLGALLACMATQSVRAQTPSNYPAPYWAPAPNEPVRAQRRAAKAAILAQRERRLRVTEQHRLQHRTFVYVGFEPVMVSRAYPGSDHIGRFRHQAVTLGAAYRHHFRPKLGLHAGGSLGVGASHIGLAVEPGSECCYPVSKSVAPSYSLNMEVAPLFGPFGTSFYVAPAWITRVILAPEHSAVLSNDDLDETVTRRVNFQPPIVATGARLNLGVMFGRHDEIDLNFGLDGGHVLHARRYLGLFLRLGVAFSDLGFSAPE